MCDLEKRYSEEQALAIEQTYKPLRIPTARVIAKKHATAIIRRIRKMEKELFGILGDIAERRGQPKPSYRSVQKWHPSELTKRDYTRQELNEAIILASQFLDAEEIQKLRNLLAQAGDDLADVMPGFGEEYYQDGLDVAYERMKRTARRQDPERFARVPATYGINNASPIVINFLNEGQRLVTSRLTIDYTARLFDIMGTAFSEGRSVASTAALVHKQIGMGAAWHWQRLVRSEAMRAYGLSARERASQAGIQYERLSLANTACPVCQSLKGTYVLGQGPVLPIHPNCRCTWIHYYRLPKGVEVRTI